MLTRTQKNHLKRLSKIEYKIILSMTRYSKLLYNETLYKIKKEWQENKRTIKYVEMYHIIKQSPNFRYLPTHVAQQTVRQLYSDCSSFFNLLRKKKNGGYNKQVNFPTFKIHENFNLIYPSTYYKIEGDQIRLTMGRGIKNDFNVVYLHLKLPKNLIGKKIKLIRFIPRYNHLLIDYVYTVAPQKSTGDNTLALDLGLNNFVTAVDADGTSFIIDGLGLKSYNRLHNA